jgi:GINS complex subunit 2
MVEPDMTRRLLRDLREVRLAKARKGVETVGDTYVQMDNLGRMEINEIRFLGHAMDRLRAFTSNGVDYGAES